MSILAALVTFVASLVLNQATVSVGDSVTFTATYPQEASRQGHASQFTNPGIQVDCDGWSDHAYIVDKDRIDGGWVSNTYPLTIPVSGSCVGTLYYFTIEDGGAVNHILAQSQFEVLP